MIAGQVITTFFLDTSCKLCKKDLKRMAESKEQLKISIRHIPDSVMAHIEVEE